MEKELKPISPEDIKIVRDIPWYIIGGDGELLQINYHHSDRLIVIMEDEIIERAF